MSQQDVVRELFLKRALDGQTDHLILQARELVETTAIARDKAMRRAQLTNVINVAMSTQTSVELVINFVRYQIGRGGKDRGWQYNQFGDQLVKRLQDLRAVADQTTAATNADIQNAVGEPAKPPVQVNQVWLRMSRLFLGFLLRAFVAQGGAQNV